MAADAQIGRNLTARRGVPAAMVRTAVRPRALTAWFALAVTLVLVGAACSGGNGTADESGGTDDAAVSSLPADEFIMPDGSTAQVADFLDGRPLVVNFFASWCPPCRAEMPDFEAVHADLGNEVRFLGLALQDTEVAAAALIEQTGVTYPWGSDPDGVLYVDFGGFSMPTTLLVTADGEIVERVNGAITEGDLRDKLSAHFGTAS